MNRKIYQDQYDFELNQKNHLASSANVPIMVMTIVGGALSSMVLDFPYAMEDETFNVLSFTFFALSIGCAISLLVSTFLLFRAFIGYEHMKLPPPSDLSRYYEKLLQWHSKNGGGASDAKRDFDDYFCQRLIEAAQRNGENNKNRGNFLHTATIMIAAATLFLAISGALYVSAKRQNDAIPYKVQIIGTVETQIGESNGK